jgi:hypothetical protein
VLISLASFREQQDGFVKYYDVTVNKHASGMEDPFIVAKNLPSQKHINDVMTELNYYQKDFKMVAGVLMIKNLCRRTRIIWRILHGNRMMLNGCRAELGIKSLT